MSPSLQNNQPYRFHRTPVAAFMRIILCVPAFSLTASLMSPVYAAQVTESTHTFAIPAASLAAQLNQFAAQSGIFLASDARLTAGKSGPALKGSYLIADGFSRLLSGHGLMAEQQSDGSYSLKRSPKGTKWW